MGKENRIWIRIICILLGVLLSPQKIRAEEYTAKTSGLDVVFVMDYSGSMRSNDPEQIAQGMVKAFIDTVHSADIRVGFVAYNDRLLSTASPLPVRTNEERQALKQLIDGAGYSGNTDTGLGLRYAYDSITQENERKKAIVLISDGEPDLAGSTTGRVLENAMHDMEYVASACEEQEIPIYTIAFGKYDGNTEALQRLSARTSGQMYSVRKPEDLIEVLYGIFEDNIDYSIEKIADGIYAPGKQDILVKLDEPYVDEFDVLLISSQKIESVGVLYGKQQIEAVNLVNYAVAKITDADAQIKEMTVQTDTVKNQELQVYLICYRNLTPVLSVDTQVEKNRPLIYQAYFKNKDGSIITDESFYKNFSCEFTLESEEKTETRQVDTEIRNGMICGEAVPDYSGSYVLSGRLEDHMGKAEFSPVRIEVTNRSPEGSLVQDTQYTVLTGEQICELDERFSDPDGDVLRYQLKDNAAVCVKAVVQDGKLVFTPIKSGVQTLTLLVSDGEETYEYPYNVTVTPLWQAYWWVIVLAAIIAAFALWKIFHKPKPELERLTEEKKQNHFCGKLDAYFILQPEGEEEIPPLSFQMNKVKDGRVSLGALFGAYPEQAKALQLDEIFLIADEDRSMILFHRSKSGVMVGNTIACMQIQYSISFGDIIYITSPDGDYDLEIHYVAVFQ